MYRSSLWKGCTCLNFPTWRGAQNPKTVDFWLKKKVNRNAWIIESPIAAMDHNRNRWNLICIPIVFLPEDFKVADLSPIHFRKQSHRWHQAGSKYWWNQGLALIHGPNLQPWIWRKYFFQTTSPDGMITPTVDGWRNKETSSDTTWITWRKTKSGIMSNFNVNFQNDPIQTNLTSKIFSVRFCFFQQRLAVFNHRQTSFEVWMWSMGSRWIGHKYPFRLDQVSIEMVFSGFRLQGSPKNPYQNTILKGFEVMGMVWE